MLKNIKYNNIYQKFHRGVNRVNNDQIVDIAITSFGGFTDAFTSGVGRRVEISNDIVELSVNTVAEINNKTFRFTRCYTKYQLDTKELDKRQDIVKYANELDKSLDSNKNELPLIAYYNQLTEFEDITSYSRNDLTDRSLGYSNCLIVKNKFFPTQDYFKYISFIVWQKEIVSNIDNSVNNYRIAMNNINKVVKKIGYDSLVYEPNKDCLMLVKNDKMIELSKIDVNDMLFVAIVFDLNIRALILNPKSKNSFNVNGCVGITYKFDNDKKFFDLINILSKQFNKVQFLI